MARKSKLEKIYKVQNEDGYYIFKLNNMLDKNNTTKNHVIESKNIDFNSMQRLATGNLTRIDLNIIAKLCNELDCKIEDLVEYVNDSDKDI